MTVVAHTREELRELRRSLPAPVAVVMTMGALHDGHARLVEVAREQARSVVVTIFVNPLQFGAGEDFERYPRTLEADLEVCRRHGVDVVFAPDGQAVYLRPALVRVSAGALGDRLEGASRPGHFDGVLTVVAKLLHLTAPDVAVFGEKDAQQLALIRRMVDDLDFPVRVVGVPTVREDDGLARSSRNRYLDPQGRVQARRLSAALQAGAAAGPAGAGAVLAAARQALDGPAAPDAPGPLHVDYVALVDESTFDEVDPAGAAAGPARLLVAARVGSTRLIDNAPVVLGTPTQR